MLSKFAMAVKTKTIEFFAEEEEEAAEDDDAASTISLSLPASDEVITGQRVVVLKPDPPPPRLPPDAAAGAAFAAVSAFRAAYLQLQAAHSPLDPDALAAADRAAVSHLQRISDLKREFYGLNGPHRKSNSNPDQNPSFLEAQVQENQTLLRTFESVFNRLQADIDRKDAEATVLKQRLKESEAANAKLARRMKGGSLPAVEKVESLLSVGLFDSVLRDCCRSMHQFSKQVIRLMKKSNWDLNAVANSIYPDIDYAKPGHCRYAILSCICLGMFDGFDSGQFCCEMAEMGLDPDYMVGPRQGLLGQFINHMAVDPLELVRRKPDCGFAKFCERKYEQLIRKCVDSSVFGNSDENGSFVRLLESSNVIYQSFVDMASSIWLLYMLAQAYDPVVKIFQVGRGTEFSMVFMESVIRVADYGGFLPMKVGFTVIPGFQVGKTPIQCRVYLDGVKEDVF